MNKIRLCFLCFLMFLSHALYAQAWVDAVGFTPTISLQAHWMFTGTVVNENGDFFNYVFNMDRDGSDFHARVALIDAQTQEILISEDTHAILTDPTSYNWHVGHTFLSFNPINASWIFGIAEKNKVGFNFKMDLLKPSQQTPIAQNLTSGVSFLAIETGLLNGHIQYPTAQKEHFITAKTAWFRQIWMTATDDHKHQIHGTLCQLKDWSGFYALQVLEKNALQASVVGSFDAEGQSIPISQFIDVHPIDPQKWRIHIVAPHLNFDLKSVMVLDNLIAGFIVAKDKRGFCVLD